MESSSGSSDLLGRELRHHELGKMPVVEPSGVLVESTVVVHLSESEDTTQNMWNIVWSVEHSISASRWDDEEVSSIPMGQSHSPP